MYYALEYEGSLLFCGTRVHLYRVTMRLLSDPTRYQGRRIRGLRMREHLLNMEVHPLTAKNTPSK